MLSFCFACTFAPVCNTTHQTGCTLHDIAGVQTPGVLDDVFFFDGPLGANVGSMGVDISLWAPTAQQVACHAWHRHCRCLWHHNPYHDVEKAAPTTVFCFRCAYGCESQALMQAVQQHGYHKYSMLAANTLEHVPNGHMLNMPYMHVDAHRRLA